MKCHFSLCGQYLHIVSLEGQRRPVSQCNTTQPPIIKLARLLLTYHLSSRKLTRSPPVLIHCAKVNLGSQATLSVSKLPYTLTWVQNELYFTCSGNTLNVYCIHLFSTNVSHDLEEIHEVLILKKTALACHGAAPSGILLSSCRRENRRPNYHWGPFIWFEGGSVVTYWMLCVGAKGLGRLGRIKRLLGHSGGFKHREVGLLSSRI